MPVQCKTEPGENHHTLVIKGTAFMGPMYHLIKEAFPNIRLLYNTRNATETLQSLLKVSRATPETSK